MVQSPAMTIKRHLSNVFLGTVTAVLVLVVLTPLVIVILASVMDSAAIGMAADQFVGAAPQNFSLEGFRYVLDTYGEWMGFSARLAALCVLICIAVALPAGYVLVRYPFAGARLVEELIMLPLSLPGIAMSVALLSAYNPLRGWWLVLAGHVVYTLPFMIRTVTGALRGSRIALLEQAGASLGAGFWQRFAWIVVPACRHGLILGALLVFAVSWGEFNVSYLLNSGKPQTFPAALYDTYANESFQVSSAATTLFLIVMLPAALGIQWLGGRGGMAVRQGA